MKLKGIRVLVTGGTGFIGGRLVERLIMDYSADVRVLVKNFARAPRIARFPIEMSPGDITEAGAVERAVDGCEIIFHCAYGNAGSPALQKQVTVQGTENVLEAALKHEVKRVVHISTVSVYGKTRNGELDESAPRKRSGDVYADSKLEAEKLAFKYFEKHGLPVVVIQPTIVYGPFGGPWTLNPINQLKKGRVIVVEGGRGLCNAVYVDDVIQAMVLAAIRNEAVGEAFLISAEEPVTWHDFYGVYERILGVESTISMSLREIEELNRRYKKAQSTIGQVMTALRGNPYILSRFIQLPAVARAYRPASILTPDSLQNRLRAVLKADGENTRHGSPALPEKPILRLTKAQIDFFLARTHVRIDKAKRLLGYEPSFSFERGMKMTEMWARYSNLV